MISILKFTILLFVGSTNLGAEKLCFHKQELHINTTSSVTSDVIFFLATKQQIALGSNIATQHFQFC